MPNNVGNLGIQWQQPANKPWGELNIQDRQYRSALQNAGFDMNERDYVLEGSNDLHKAIRIAETLDKRSSLGTLGIQWQQQAGQQTRQADYDQGTATYGDNYEANYQNLQAVQTFRASYPGAPAIEKPPLTNSAFTRAYKALNGRDMTWDTLWGLPAVLNEIGMTIWLLPYMLTTQDDADFDRRLATGDFSGVYSAQWLNNTFGIHAGEAGNVISSMAR